MVRRSSATVLAQAADSPGRTALTLSADCRHVAFVETTGRSQNVFLDDQMQGSFQEVAEGPLFSPDSQHLGWIVREKKSSFVLQKKSSFVVVDSREGPRFDSAGCFTFGPDSRRTAYIEQTRELVSAVLDGVALEPYDDIASKNRAFSADSRHFAYAGKRQGKWYVVSDGIVLEPRPDLVDNSLMFSPDGRTIAYAIGISGKRDVFFVIGGAEQQHYDDLLDMQAFSPDSRQFAYGARQGEYARMVVNGHEGKPYSSIGSKSLAFSPDSQRMAYAAHDGEKWVIAVDGTERGPYDSVGSLVFSPDGRRFAYKASVGGRWFSVVDEERGNAYDGIGPITFTPDSQKIAYAAVTGSNFFVVLDQVEGSPYEMIWFPPGIIFESGPIMRYVASDQGRIMSIAEDLRDSSGDIAGPTENPAG
jgi:WD40 repeat protein